MLAMSQKKTFLYTCEKVTPTDHFLVAPCKLAQNQPYDQLPMTDILHLLKRDVPRPDFRLHCPLKRKASSKVKFILKPE